MIGDRATVEFVRIRLSDTLAAAREALPAGGALLGAVVDEDARPVTLVTATDLAALPDAPDTRLRDYAGRLPPGVVARADLALHDFVQRPEFNVLAAGARGVIVFDDESLVGVVPAATVTAYLRDNFQLAPELKGAHGDTRLPGSIVNKPIIMYCDTCNYRNELDYYNRRKPPPCQNDARSPHPIRRRK